MLTCNKFHTNIVPGFQDHVMVEAAGDAPVTDNEVLDHKSKVKQAFTDTARQATGSCRFYI